MAILSGAAQVSAQSSARLAANDSFRAMPPRPTFEHVVQEFVDDERAAPQVFTLALIPNLGVTGSLRSVIESMMQVSLTFRRQCARLAAAENLTIFVAASIGDPSRLTRATTQFSVAPEGRLVARILVGPYGSREELLAHEFEHVLEQLDGVDLAALSQRNATGVSLIDGTRFETVRAVAIGRQVVEEIANARRRE